MPIRPTFLALFVALAGAGVPLALPTVDVLRANSSVPEWGNDLAAVAREEVVETWPGGAPRRVYEVDDEGRRHGTFLEYRIDGQLVVRAKYAKGELNGRYESFHPNGERFIDCSYKKGLLNGRYSEFDEEGERRVTGKYDDGLADGDFEYRRAGEVVSEQEWKDGELVELDGFVNPFPRSIDAVADDLRAVRALEIEPVFQSDEEGEIDAELATERVAALRRLMEYRALSGLEWADMRLDDRFNWHCSAAARMLTVLGRLDHTPKNPGLPEDEYKVAYEGTSKSNLALGSTLPGSIDSYMDDSDPSNVDRVGHRRWCLNPAMLKTGFGIDGRFSAMWSFDESRGQTKWEYVAYPAPGVYSTDHIVDGAAWSVRFRRGVLDGLQPNDLVVELFALDEDLVRGAPMRLDHLSIYAGQVIFRGASMNCAPGRAYEVRISKVGKRSPELMLRYYVRFADVEGLLAAEAEPEAALDGDADAAG
jgi:hypothetical protein